MNVDPKDDTLCFVSIHSGSEQALAKLREGWRGSRQWLFSLLLVLVGRRFNVSEGTLRCLLALPLRVREDERARAKARVKSKNRKRRKEGSVEAGLMEADARLDDDVRAKCEADALHEVR